MNRSFYFRACHACSSSKKTPYIGKVIKNIIICMVAMTTTTAIAMNRHHTLTYENFQAPPELHPRDQKKLFNQLQQIPHHNIVAAVLCYGAEHKNDQAQLAVHALINPFNWHNAKLITEPLVALCGGAVTYAVRTLPRLQLLSVACMLVGLYRTWQRSSKIGDFGRVCKIYKNSKPLTDDRIPKEDQEYINQLSPLMRIFLRTSHISMPTSNLEHTKIDMTFASPNHGKLLYFGELYRKCYLQRLDAWGLLHVGKTYSAYCESFFQSLFSSQPTPCQPIINLYMGYHDNSAFSISVPIMNYQKASGVFCPRPEQGWVHYRHIFNIARLENAQINEAYEQGKELVCNFYKAAGDDEPFESFTSSDCLDRKNQESALLAWFREHDLYITIE